MGNMITGYPELFGAIVCQVPLLDMKRYSHLLAGASWMAEYGDPDDPEQWEFIKTFSAYHRFDAEGHHPPVLFTTSTRDDRVHPGHARKMMALMAEAGRTSRTTRTSRAATAVPRRTPRPPSCRRCPTSSSGSDWAADRPSRTTANAHHLRGRGVVGVRRGQYWPVRMRLLTRTSHT